MTTVELSSVSMIPCVSFDPSTLTGSFQSMNGSGFDDDIKIMQIYNGGTVGIDISFDGVTKHAYWPPGATLIVDFQTNHADNSAYGSGTKYGRTGQIIYGRTTSTATHVQIMGYR